MECARCWVVALAIGPLLRLVRRRRHRKKGTQVELCIRILWGRSLRHPSFVAVVHHSFTDLFTYYTVGEVPTCKNIEAMLCVFQLPPIFYTQD